VQAPRGRQQEEESYDECTLGSQIHAANVMAKQEGLARGAPVLYEMPPTVKQSLGVSDAQYEGLKQAIVQEVVRVQEALRI